jgi:hypothetical protein
MTPQVIGVIKDLLQILLIIGGSVVAWLYFFVLAPQIRLQLSHRWMDGNATVGVLTIQVTNTSKVRIRKDSLRLQMLFYPIARMATLTDWVPFSKDSTVESTDRWRNPQEICEQTKYVYPGETMTVEHPLVFEDCHSVGHVGLQFRAELNAFESF